MAYIKREDKDRTWLVMFIFLLLINLFTTIIFSQEKKSITNKYNNEITINDTKLFVEIAETEYSRSLGLMYRQSIPDSCGMLFVFEEEEVLSFWMRNTYIPLSIAYLDYSGYIVSIKNMIPHDEIGVSSDYPAIYALEVNKGWFLKNDVKVGDKIEF